jgi:tellurite methyltransferase
MMPKKPFWEESYKRIGKLDTFGGGKPNKTVEKIAVILPQDTKALDLGCGEGRNAVYLASLGFKVSAFDLSVAGIGKLLQVAKERHLTIDASVCDMREYRYPCKFDFIICMGCLHLIKQDEWKNVIRQMKENTVPGGWNIIGVLTDTLPEPPDMEGLMVGLFKEGELVEQYKDWEISDIRVYTFNDKHPGGISHEHAANEIVARKPDQR